MPSQKRTNTFKAYVQIPLLPDMVDTVTSFSVDHSGLLEALTELALGGYVLKVSYSSDDENMQIAAIQADPMSADEGYGYYSGGETLHQAIAACYVKYRFLVSAKKSLREMEGTGRRKLY